MWSSPESLAVPGWLWFHGVGGRTDLPLEKWQVAFGASVALVASFAVLGLAWHRPRLRSASGGRVRPISAGVARAGERSLRAIGLVVFLLVVSAAVFGDTDPRRNLAPTWIYVVFWVGVPLASAVVGDLWRALSPWRTLAGALGAGRSVVGGDPARNRWPAAAVILGFTWLELAYHEPADVRLLGWAAVAYTLAIVAGARARGLAWLDDREGFGVAFGLIASLAPLRWQDGRVRLRWPLAGVSEVEPVSGTTGVVLVLLGSTTFDGLSRTAWWGERAGNRVEWDLTLINTVGLLGTVCVVGGVFVVATRVADRLGRPGEPFERSHTSSLIPIALAYAVAHYFSLLMFEGQNAWFRLSDPYGAGWDLFGRADARIDYLFLSTTTIAWVQVAAIVTGHVAAAVAAHDRTLELVDRRRVLMAQYPLLAAMVAYTVGGLVLLLES